MDFLAETVTGLAEKVGRREISARELLDHALARIADVDGGVNAFVLVDAEGAAAAAQALDDALARGDEPGPLAGIPLAVKDLEDVAGLPTSKGSATFAGSAPASADSELVTRLRAAGCVVVGKTNTPELGFMADTVNATFGSTRNPYDLRRSPGGSSGGSAAAVAAGMVPLATGSDGGGSIRIPAAACGLSGFKPSLGRVPLGGAQPPDWVDLSTRAPMARRTADIAAALDFVIGPDTTDLRSLPMPEPTLSGAVAHPKVPFRVAWSPTLGYAHADAEVLAACRAAVDEMANLGADVVEIDTVFTADPILVWATLTGTYLLRTLRQAGLGDDWSQVDPKMHPQLELASSLSALDLVAAEDECHRLNLALVDVLARASVLVCPTTAGIPPRSGQLGEVNGIADMNWVRYTYPFNCTRSPAGTVCAGVGPSGVPIGLQIVGPQHGDAVVLRTMAALEAALGQPTPAYGSSAQGPHRGAGRVPAQPAGPGRLDAPG